MYIWIRQRKIVSLSGTQKYADYMLFLIPGRSKNNQLSGNSYYFIPTKLGFEFKKSRNLR